MSASPSEPLREPEPDERPPVGLLALLAFLILGIVGIACTAGALVQAIDPAGGRGGAPLPASTRALTALPFALGAWAASALVLKIAHRFGEPDPTPP